MIEYDDIDLKPKRNNQAQYQYSNILSIILKWLKYIVKGANNFFIGFLQLYYKPAGSQTPEGKDT